MRTASVWNAACSVEYRFFRVIGRAQRAHRPPRGISEASARSQQHKVIAVDDFVTSAPAENRLDLV
jgi:hypothetical protein